MKHAIIWLDHDHSKVFAITKDKDAEGHTVRAHHQHHGKGEKAHANSAYFHDVAKAVEGAEEILVTGPGSAKLEFLRHLHQHHAQLEKRVVGVETLDHPTDGQLIAHGKKAFARIDAML